MIEDQARAAMRAFYERHPYPQLDQIEYDRLMLDQVAYLAGTCATNRLGNSGDARGRMLIAGCGTREAVTWGLSLPRFDVDAVDLSEASLELSRHLCTRLGLTNVRHRQGNFEYGEGPEGLYDFISSFGVLHHLESPERGLAVLERHLAPGGTMAIMVYSRTQRLALENVQRMIRILAGPEATPERLSEVALALCTVGGQTDNRLTRLFRHGLENHKNNPPQFADTLLNPRERCYTIPELAEFLGAAGLEIVAPMQPVFWDVRGYLDDALYAAFAARPLLERLEIVDHLIGPMFWVIVRRTSERVAPRPCDTDAGLFWDIVPMPMDTGTWPMVRHEPARAPLPAGLDVRPIEGSEQLLMGRHSAAARPFHPIALKMVRLFDGRRTFGEIAREACRQEGVPFEAVEAALASILRMLVEQMAVAAPDPLRCARCPNRCAP